MIEQTDVLEPPSLDNPGPIYVVQHSTRLETELDWGDAAFEPRENERSVERERPAGSLQGGACRREGEGNQTLQPSLMENKQDNEGTLSHSPSERNNEAAHPDVGEKESGIEGNKAGLGWGDTTMPSASFATPHEGVERVQTKEKMARSVVAGPPIHGILGSQPLENVFVSLERMRASGMLHVHANKGVHAKIRFQRGIIMDVGVDADMDIEVGILRLGERFIEERLLKPEQISAGMRRLETKGGRLGAALIQLHFIETQEVLKTLRVQFRERMAYLFALDQGHFEFEYTAHADIPPPRPALSPRREIFRIKVENYRLRLVAEAEEIEAPFRDFYVFRRPGAPDDLSLVGFDAGEKRFADLCITGKHTLRQVYTISPIARRHAHGVVFAMKELGWLEFRREMDAKAQEEELIKMWSERAHRVQGATLFEVLEVHWTALDSEIKEAYTRLRAECNQADLKGRADLEKHRRIVLGRLEEAHSALHERRARKAYRETIIEPDQITFMADLLCKQGELALFKEDYRDAAEKFARALELVPGLKSATGRLEELQRHGLG